ncbi:MAG: DUF3034 family protein [Candidatus Omnitrophica bacterium]|nr:DUF3034 family protein [Candidatus Omnitrophota bacterium]MDD5236308.1 DUF3034 family protein [Candidatus Omnitrophota bacterium]MDD5610311.1 DUF3034 family protein [Candidatus Omnitrophota bacterium]
MRKTIVLSAILVLVFVSYFDVSEAGVPFNNLEGVGGVALNPLAYLADSGNEKDYLKIGDVDVLGKPRFGGWYVNLDDVKVDWTAFGVADTLFKRIEVSYGYETIAQSNSPTRHKNNLGAKLLLIPENFKDNKFIPAVSVGSIWKNASDKGLGVDTDGTDYYLVFTKLITQLPKPVLLSGGVLSTRGRVNGIFGFDKKRKEVAFGNIDVLLTKKIVIGFEYKQGAKYPDFKNANYWDAHLGLLVNKNLSLIAAYVNAGNSKSGNKVGLGDGVVLSAQYSF